MWPHFPSPTHPSHLTLKPPLKAVTIPYGQIQRGDGIHLLLEHDLMQATVWTKTNQIGNGNFFYAEQRYGIRKKARDQDHMETMAWKKNNSLKPCQT